MPLLDCSKEPHTIMFSGAEVEQIKLLKQETNGKHTIGFKDDDIVTLEAGPIYNVQELLSLTIYLMRCMNIRFDPQMHKESLTLDRFSERAKKELRPLAAFLACIDGNCYRPNVDAYIPHVHAILVANGLNTFTFREYMDGFKS